MAFINLPQRGHQWPHHQAAGVIHFKGQIVEYGCNLAPHDRNIEVSCLRNNIPHLQTVATP
ncbi:hypothetical protein MJM95_27240, partial [Salmonella enterica subsp. enterica serovar Anatum]|nr:hypothetical protein [Salmonella enterica subsp. enterica serovar Anatum]